MLTSRQSLRAHSWAPRVSARRNVLAKVMPVVYDAQRMVPQNGPELLRHGLLELLAAAPVSSGGGDKVGVLFVCLGNICRSPTAEAQFRAVVERHGLSNKFDIDSSGTGGGNPNWYLEGSYSYHEGDAADYRMTATAKKRGVYLTSRSRPLNPLDLSRFDYILGMDRNNMAAMQVASDYWLSKDSKSVPLNYQDRLLEMWTFCRKQKAGSIPDPYYGGEEGFEKVLDLLDDACEGLLEHIREERGI
eukprot:gene22263-29335_t